MSGTPTRDTVARALQERFPSVVSIAPLAADASTRWFFRMQLEDGGSAVALVDVAGGQPALERLLAALRLLHDLELPAPRRLGEMPEIDAVVLEDLGDLLLADALGDPARHAAAPRWYAQAGQIAARIAARGTATLTPPSLLATPQLGPLRLRRELSFFVTHDLAGRRGIQGSHLVRAWGDLLDEIVRQATQRPLVAAHRDLHARNLIVRDDDTLGIVDFQDLLLAPAYYDLASLLVDPYVSLPTGLEHAAIEGYAREFGEALDPRLDPLFVWVALQRLLKALGTYAFQSRRLGRERFAASIPIAEARALHYAAELAEPWSSMALELFERARFGRVGEPEG